MNTGGKVTVVIPVWSSLSLDTAFRSLICGRAYIKEYFSVDKSEYWTRVVILERTGPCKLCWIGVQPDEVGCTP